MIVTKGSKEEKQIILRVILSFGCLVIAAIFLVSSAYRPYEPNQLNKSQENKNQSAWNCATDVVKKELRNYSNVDVSGYSSSEITFTTTTGIYTIKGTVSYTNSLGVKLNNKFTVNLELTESGYKNSSILIY